MQGLCPHLAPARTSGLVRELGVALARRGAAPREKEEADERGGAREKAGALQRFLEARVEPAWP